MRGNGSVSSISSFYSGRSILVTGATGFLGKVLIEKLLRSCPDIREIFLLMRPVNKVGIDERLQQLSTKPLFDRLRSEQPGCFEKLIPVKGDIGLEGLGLSSVDRDMLIEKTSVIFHIAANVRFDDTLKNTLLNNVRSTRDICVLAERMKNLISLVHVSSTYAQVDKFVVDEITYPTEVDWRKAIQIAETLDEHILEIFKTKYIGTMPNQYVFSKRLAEQVIIDYSGSLPCTICRPSIVTPTLREPVKGWLDNLNGPTAFVIGSGKGVLRVCYGDFYTRDNYVPVDVVVKAMIAAAWKCGTSDTQHAPPVVYNCAANDATNLSRIMVVRIGMQLGMEIPLEGMIWTPGLISTKTAFFYYVLVLLLHVIPALIGDGLLRLMGRRPKLLKLQRRIFTSNQIIKYFLSNEWHFRNQKLLGLSNEIPLDNQEDFGFAMDLNYNFNKVTYFKNCVIGAKTYLLHEDMDRLNIAKLHSQRMLWIDRIVKVLLAILFVWNLLL